MEKNKLHLNFILKSKRYVVQFFLLKYLNITNLAKFMMVSKLCREVSDANNN